MKNTKPSRSAPLHSTVRLAGVPSASTVETTIALISAIPAASRIPQPRLPQRQRLGGEPVHVEAAGLVVAAQRRQVDLVGLGHLSTFSCRVGGGQCLPVGRRMEFDATSGGERRAHKAPYDEEHPMADETVFKPGLEGVIAFETEIAEPDKEGSALRYRGVDIEDLVGRVSYGNVWGLLVDGRFAPGLPPAEPFPVPVHSGDIRVDVQSALATLAPAWGLQQLLDIDDEQARDDLARCSVTAMSFVAQSARGIGQPMVPQKRIDECSTVVERFMTRWRGEPDPAHTKAVDAYFVSAAEHGINASTFTARIIASTGADSAACLSGAVGALSGPLHGGAPARVLKMLDEVAEEGDARRVRASGCSTPSSG